MDNPKEREIRNEIYRALELIGADRHLLGAIGSWGDTLEDAAVLELLKDWNRREAAARRRNGDAAVN